MVVNAKAVYDSGFLSFIPLPNIVPAFAGSVDYVISADWLIRCTLLLGAVLFVADLSQSDRWLLRLWYAIVIVGASIGFLGLLQKATGAQMIFWQPPPPPEVWVTTFFATYYYHGNAGAFLNLVWPLSLGLVIRSFGKRSHPGLRPVWIVSFMITIAAVLANTSRMAQLVAVLLLTAVSVQFGPALLRRLSRAQKSAAVAGALAVVLALVAVAQASHLEQPLNRWRAQSGRIPIDYRWQAWSVALKALPNAGFFGSGAGTLRVVFPSYKIAAKNDVPGSWRFLHQDYLQTVLEWGWLGSSLWALLFFGGIIVAIRNYRKHSRNWTPRRRVLQPVVIIALAGVAMHALVDFPLQIESIQLYVAAYLGLCWGSSLWERL